MLFNFLFSQYQELVSDEFICPNKAKEDFFVFVQKFLSFTNKTVKREETSIARQMSKDQLFNLRIDCQHIYRKLADIKEDLNLSKKLATHLLLEKEVC